MSKTLEQVKAAIAAKFAPAIDFHAPYAKVMLDVAARAALEALRLPEAEVVDAGANFAWFEGRNDEKTAPLEVWNAMIDRILLT
jgi:hypothetical protein